MQKLANEAKVNVALFLLSMQLHNTVASLQCMRDRDYIRHSGHGVQLQGLVPLKKTELLDDNYSQVIYKTMVVPEQQLLIQY